MTPLSRVCLPGGGIYVLGLFCATSRLSHKRQIDLFGILNRDLSRDLHEGDTSHAACLPEGGIYLWDPALAPYLSHNGTYMSDL